MAFGATVTAQFPSGAGVAVAGIAVGDGLFVGMAVGDGGGVLVGLGSGVAVLVGAEVLVGATVDVGGTGVAVGGVLPGFGVGGTASGDSLQIAAWSASHGPE